ncbi:MAG TPA: ATP-binding protein [Anaerolineales bacterium]|nr:ATP-binding protein [Anaerolineales bacterium]
MNAYLQRHLGTKLFLSYLAIILVGVVVLILASQFVLPAAFDRHMNGMMGNGGMPNGMMGQTNGSMSQLYIDFRASFNEALIYAAFAAMSAAILLSFLFSRNVIAAVQSMSLATQRIAEGRYEERVQVNGEDELAQLAARFNQMAEKLSQVESMRRRLIGDVSHELRTPLTAIKGSMEGLIDGVLPANDETYQQIHAEADRLNRLVDDLQELSRVESRAYELDIRPLDVSALVQTVIKRLAAKAQAKHISLNLELDPDLPPALTNEDRAIQVLTNLTGNALQYTHEGGNVTIFARHVNNEIQISVHDTGIGISAEHLSRIFDRFYRVDKSRSRQSGGGSGIGLTIARALVEAHGGRIWAESAGEEQGSTFTFTLPVG